MDGSMSKENETELYKCSLPFEKRHLAKEAGFYWDSDNKQWRKRMTPEQAAKIQFHLIKVEG